jgi:hypothetical protein
VRIDPTHSPEPHGLPEGKPGSAKPPRPPGADDRPTAESAELLAAHKPYVSKAMEADEIDLQAVQEAKRLLESGQLFSPEAVLRAARKLLADGS